MADLRIAVLTCSRPTGEDALEDECGRAIIEACEDRGWFVVAYHVCQSEMESISTSLLEMSDMENADFVLTIGGIGLGPWDVTPEATTRIVERSTPGFAELVRSAASDSPAASALFRGTAGLRGRTLIVNLPDDLARALASFEAVADLFEDAVAMIAGEPEARS